MAKSRRNHNIKMYNLRLGFKNLLASLFFESPLSFASFFLDGKLDNALQGIWSEWVKSEHFNPDVYKTEFSINCCKGKTDDDIFLFIYMPDVVDVTNLDESIKAYSWHKSLGVGYILYNNLKTNVSRFYVCDSSVNSTLRMYFRYEFAPVYFIVEYTKNGKVRTVRNICSNSFDEIKLRFYKIVMNDVENTCIHSDIWNAILNKAPVEEIKKLIEAGANLNEEGSAEDIEKDDNYDIINILFDHPDCFELIKLFVEHGFDVKKILKSGVNAVTESIFCDDPRVFFYLYNIDKNLIFQPENMDGWSTLSLAAMGCENPKIIKFLVDELGWDVNSVNEHGWGLIHHAVSNPNPDILRMLIDYGVPVENKDYKELNPFHPLDYSIINEPENLNNLSPLALASIEGTPEICEILIKAGARLEAKDQKGQTPLMLSTRNKNPEVFRLLLKYGANINALDYMKQGVLNHALKNSPLEIVKEIAKLTNAHFHNYNYEIYIKNIEKMRATRYSAQNDPKFLETLLEAGIDPRLPKEKKLPFIFLAAENPDLRVMDFLAENGCDLSLGTQEENVASHALENNSNPKIIDYLMNNNLWINDDYFISEHISKNPNVEVWKSLWGIGFPLTYQDENGISLLMKVLHNNTEPDLEVVKFLSYETTVKLKDKNGTTASHYAAQLPDLNYLTILELSGANLGEVNLSGLTPFMMACRFNSNPSFVKYFLDDGFSINQESFQGMNLAHCAASNPKPDVMQTLIDYGVDFDKENLIDKNTPLELAAWTGNVEVCKVLIKAGSKLEHKDRYGATALLLSTKSNNPEVFRLLVKSGANIKVKDKQKETIIGYALGNSSLEFVKEIEELTNPKYDDSNFENYIKEINYINFRSYQEKLMGLPSNEKKSVKLPFILHAALNPDIRVLNYLKEKGCNIYAGNYDENVIAYALSGNPNPNMVNYLLGNKIDEKLYEMVFDNISKNPSINVLNRVFELGFPYEYQDENGTSLLMNVLKKNNNPNPEIIAFLSHEKTVNLKDNYGVTACHYASKKDYLIYLQILHSKGAKFNEKDNYQNLTPLMFACCKSSNPEIIDYLIEKGNTIKERDSMGNDALLWSMSNTNLEIIKHLIDLGADIHTKNRKNENILIVALKNKANLELINYLISLGIDVNEKSDNGYPSSFYAACSNPYPEVLDLLVKKGAKLKVDGVFENEILLWAVANNTNKKVIEYLINTGLNINLARPEGGETALLIAAKNPNIKIFKMLIEKGGNIRDVDSNNNNALHIAAVCNENPSFIEYLLDNGFSLKDKDKFGNTAVFGASRNININVIKTMVSRGGDLKETDNYGHTILMYLFRNAHNRDNSDISLEMVKYLLENGVDVNARNNINQTALMFAVDSVVDPKFIELLIAAGADINAEDDNGYNAYRIAKEYNPNPAIAETIKKYMTMASYKETPFNIPSTSDIN